MLRARVFEFVNSFTQTTYTVHSAILRDRLPTMSSYDKYQASFAIDTPPITETKDLNPQAINTHPCSF